MGSCGGVGSADGLTVEVVFALPDRYCVERATLPRGATVADALAAVAGREPFAMLDLARMPVGVYGELVERGKVLDDGDRVELYRPLQVDPREARRRRASVRRR